jgi:hypothetical protein
MQTKAEKALTRYQRLKLAGICVRCKKKPARQDMTECQDCANEYAINIDYLKSLKICICCRNEDAEPNNALCFECGEKKRKANRQWLLNMSEDEKKLHKAKSRAKTMRRYYRLKLEGICTRCGKRKAQEGIIFCIDCRIKKNRQDRERNQTKRNCTIPQSHRTEYGLCYFCGKNAVPGKKTCESCLERLRKNMAKARAVAHGMIRPYYWSLATFHRREG